jgi:hypothetical protein
VANVEGAYCATEDLRTGDIAVPSYTSKEQYIKNAAEEIDAAVGHLYVTPFAIDETVPANRPSVLFLKKLNWLLASGRFVLDVAAAGEMDNLHAYGKRMLDEAAAMLKYLTSEELVLVGATKIESDDEQKGFTGPMIHNEDPESLVEAFYRRQRGGLFTLSEVGPAVIYPRQVVPYGE